jgi:hypothetical protein
MSAQTVESRVQAVIAALEKKGYEKIKEGHVNTTGFSKIQTWMKRGKIVYLVYNEAGTWDLLRSIFGDKEPLIESIAEGL